MLFRSTVVFTALGLAANQALAAAVEAPRDVAAVQIAIDPFYACNCPNNCSYKAGSSCKYKAGPSTNSSTIKGKCQNQSGKLICVPN